MKFLDFSFLDIMRAGYVKRWSIVEMSRPQSISEHSFNVAIISALIFGSINPDRSDPDFEWELKLIMFALSHDLPELYSGDIPTPFKSHLKGQIESVERALCPAYAKVFNEIDTKTKTITKIADIIDAIQFADRHCIDSRKESIIKDLVDEVSSVLSDIPDSCDDCFKENLAIVLNNLWIESNLPYGSDFPFNHEGNIAR